MAYFVTGATGFIGRYLVRELLARDSSAPVFILLRRESLTKLEGLRQWWGAAAARVEVIEGDLTRPALGIQASDQTRLRGRIEHLFHLGALYDLGAAADALAAANIEGTRHVLEFAQAMDVGCLHHCSSIAAAGLYRGLFTEDMFEEASGLEHPYFSSKHEAESLVRRQSRVPWRIYRPGMVIGDSATGHISKIDGPYYFFKMLQILRRNLPAWLPLLGIEGGQVNVVPVDYVVRAMVYLAHCQQQDGRCFHLTDPQPRSAGEVLNLFARAAHAPVLGLRFERQLLELVPPMFKHLLQEYPPLRAVVDQVLEDLEVPRHVLRFVNFPTRFDNAHAAALLEPAGIRPPPLEDYAWRLWDYWERHLDPDLAVDRSLRGAVAQQRVLITGGSSGIGKATALQLASAGATVLIAARDPEKLAATRSEITERGGIVHAYPCDIVDPSSVERLVSTIHAEHGGLDVLINNAGHSIRRSLEASYARAHDFERLIQVNYLAAVRLTMAFLPSMVAQRRGHVIMISSIGVLNNAPRFAGYIASKAALEAFTRAAASEYRHRQVHFSVINMPLVRTPMIAPTSMYRALPALSPAEAAGLVVEAILHKSPRVASRLGIFAKLVDLFAPRFADVFGDAYYHMFPDSVAARGDGGEEEPPTPEAIAFANLLKGLHW